MSASVTDAGHVPHRYAMSVQVIGPWSGHSTVTCPQRVAGRLIRGFSTPVFYHAPRCSHDLIRCRAGLLTEAYRGGH